MRTPVIRAKSSGKLAAPREGPELREQEGKSVAIERSRLPYNRDPSRARNTRPKVTREDVRRREALTGELWVIIEDKAYDLTEFQHRHPGGYLCLRGVAGRNATEAFDNFHPAKVWETLLPAYHVADVTDVAVSEYVAGHREIRQQLLERGLFETRPSYYAKVAAWLAALLAAAVGLTVAGGGAGPRLLGAAVLGFFWQQLAFLGHDIGHNSITHKRGVDSLLGAAHVALFGVSMAWWKRSHNTHHVVCNSVENDPDIQHLPVLAVSPAIFEGFASTYHAKAFAPLVLDPIAHFIVSYQHLLYYVFMFFGRYNLYVQSFALLLDFKERRAASTRELLAYVIISHGVSGILHVQITLSHFCMETFTKDQPVYTADENDWFRLQLATTMDVDCPEWLDWFHGGLQFQIEHHLFPRVPRHNLREVRKLVKAFCKKEGLHYHEVSFLQGNAEVIAGLYETALAARRLPRDGKSIGRLRESWTWEMLNAQG
ncbi:hypothetical protein JL720_4778 [Aureococcus anophagefferens]|nr:hypothetical protein JL720_4778 [Aureococcus anophagefferens]